MQSKHVRVWTDLRIRLVLEIASGMGGNDGSGSDEGSVAYRVTMTMSTHPPTFPGAAPLERWEERNTSHSQARANCLHKFPGPLTSPF